MSSNGHATPLESLSDILCTGCGLPADPDSDHVVIEVRKGWTPQTLSALFGTVAVTMIFSSKVKNHDQLYSGMTRGMIG